MSVALRCNKRAHHIPTHVRLTTIIMASCQVVMMLVAFLGGVPDDLL
jgi:hypothetical protein